MANQKKNKVVALDDDPNQIWFLTSIWVEILAIHPTTGEIKTSRETRTFGYYRGFQKALQAVKDNRGNMHECLYQYLVMERIGEGVHALVEDEHWFKWSDKQWVFTEKPRWAIGFANWAIG